MRTNSSAGALGEEGNSTLRYEAVATLNLANRTVTHVVERSNRPDYVGKTLTRSVRYDPDESLLTLTLEEKMFGTAFALLWTPSNVSASLVE
jgi:hypothetical protein